MLTTNAHRRIARQDQTRCAVQSRPTAEAARERLRASRFVAFHAVSCSFEDGVLTLRGVVATYYFKQLAQTIVRTVDDVSRVDNCICVRSSASEESHS
jgi:osmotically-inducible protein OsmY